MVATFFSNFLSPGSLTGDIPAQQSYGSVLCAVIMIIEYRQLTYKAKENFMRICIRES